MQLGLLIRGAITVGKAFHTDSSNTVFGPAVNRAVCLEQEMSGTPRVIIDPKLVSPTSQIYLKLDSDGYWFVNGLNLTVNGLDAEKAKIAIENGLKNENEKYRQKWQWMAMQFNEELEKLKKDDIKKIVF